VYAGAAADSRRSSTRPSIRALATLPARRRDPITLRYAQTSSDIYPCSGGGGPLLAVRPPGSSNGSAELRDHPPRPL